MEQNRLKDLEQRCVQEELPYCQAACPLKVNVRGFCAALAKGNHKEARTILARAVPLPEILGRLCEHPCENACIRKEKGGAIEIGRLERSCLEKSSPPPPPLRPPSKEGKVILYGGGLSSLVCAHELARKGYQVSLEFVSPTPGGRLGRLSEDLLPKSVLQESWNLLQRMGVVPVPREELIFTPPPEGTCAYVGADDPELQHPFSEEEVNPLTRETPLKGVFAGGFSREGKASSLWETVAGKGAATSMDRLFQGASLSSGREKELSRETKLYTPLHEVEDLKPQGDPLEEARRCLQCECLYCVRECAFLEAYRKNPRLYAREIYNNFAIVHGDHKANRMINSCALCGLCEVLCPFDFSMGDLCRSAREEMVSREIMPPSAHEFALLDMEQANAPRAAGFRPGKGGITEAVLFPGCQLGGTLPDQTEALVSFLEEKFEGTLGLLLGCCGAPAWWGGRKKMLMEIMNSLKNTLNPLGNPPLILACSSCNEVFRRFLPEIPRISLWELLLEKGLPPGESSGEILALHDPCTTRKIPEWQEAAREILRKIHQPFEELDFSGETTRCCGYGGLQSFAAPEIAAEGVRRRLEESQAPFLTYCAMCRESLFLPDRRTFHLLELLFPASKAPEKTGFSQRRENRERLRSRLLGEGITPREPWEDLELSIAPEVRNLLEERHILDEDLRCCLWEASKNGEGLVSPEGVFLARSRRGNVTFWVEYLPKGGERREEKEVRREKREAQGEKKEEGQEKEIFEIRNAWSHRMTLELIP
jgi:Fe-S oxidoreductase